MLCVFLFLLGIELGEAAQVVFELVVFGVGSQSARTFHHEAAEDGQHKDAEREVERPSTMAVEEEICYSGSDDKDVGNPLIYAQGSLIVHSVDIIVLR